MSADPAKNKVVDDTYIKLAAGRDYGDVAPVIGTDFGSGISTMQVTLDVRKLDGGEKLRSQGGDGRGGSEGGAGGD